MLLFVFIWMRTTLPRLRYDQLMRFGWKVLLPVATLNAVITAILGGGDLVGVHAMYCWLAPQAAQHPFATGQAAPVLLLEVDERAR